jgi:hypothetical protein
VTDDLGRLLSEHPTDNSRRTRIATIALVIGGLALLIGIPLNIRYFATPWGSAAEDPRYWSGSGMLEVGLIVVGVFGLVVGGLLLAMASRSKGERFDLYERGITHHHGDAVETIPWSDIESVEQRGMKVVSAVPRLPGVEYRCVLKLRDGRQLGFGTYTKDAFSLADRIQVTLSRKS